MLETLHNRSQSGVPSFTVVEEMKSHEPIDKKKQAWLKILETSEKSEKSPLVLEEFETYFINLCQHKADEKAKKDI